MACDARGRIHPNLTHFTAAANAVVDVLLGERYKLAFLLPGVALVAAGIVLCTLK